jgi:hypothetical protein
MSSTEFHRVTEWIVDSSVDDVHELEGIGRWTLRPEGSKCHVRYDWIVKVTKPWMVRFSFILKPIFRWNYNVVMERGRPGLVRHLARDR